MAVREHVGWYLWTHQLVEVQGEDARDFLDFLCTKMISTLKTGKERYTTILDENAEIIDDVVVFRLEEQKFWVSTLFAGNLIHWMASHQGKSEDNIQRCDRPISYVCCTGTGFYGNDQ